MSEKPVQKQKRLKKFKISQNVVYPLQGVGVVNKILEKQFRDKVILYYEIYIEANDMTVMIPVDKIRDLGLRAIASKEESKMALELTAKKYEPQTSDWKQRYQMNFDFLKKGEISDIAIVVQKLYHRSKAKELPIMERKLYDNALRLMIDEISLSLNKTKDDTEDIIITKLESINKS